MNALQDRPVDAPILPRSVQPLGAHRLDFLDGVRALAALWVVVSHLWISQFGLSPRGGLLGLLSNWLLYSHFAVDIFIVLSGYCLMLPVIRHEGLRGGALTFYRRRARRILPPFYVALAFAVVLAAVTHRLDYGTWYVNKTALAVNLLLLQDALLKWNIFDSPLWSVAVEWRIYFLFPVLVVILFRYGRFTMLIAAGLAGYLLTALVQLRYPTMLLSCPWYLFLFAMGVVAAQRSYTPVRGGPSALSSLINGWHDAIARFTKLRNGYAHSFDEAWHLRRPTLLAAGFLVLACLAVRYHPLTNDGGVEFGRNMPWIDALVGAAAAAFLLRVHRAQQLGGASRTLRLFTWPPLVRLGGFSYSLYLVHRLVIILLVRLLPLGHLAILASPLACFAVLLTLGLPITIAVSYLFYRAFEQPSMGQSA